MARNPVQFQQPQRIPLALRMLRRPVPMAMAQWDCGHNRLPTPAASSNSAIAATARPRSPRNHLRLHQAAPDGVVSGHLPHDPGQERGLAMKLHRHLGISYRRVAHQHKLAGDDGARPEHPLGGSIQLDDAYLGGERSGGKRGRRPLSPPCRPTSREPVAHEAHRRGGLPSHRAAWAQLHLGTGTRVVSDGLACFHGVTAAGCVHESVVVGSGKAAVERPEFRWVNTILGNIKNALRQRFGMLSISLGVRVSFQSSLRTSSRDLSTGAQDAADPERLLKRLA